MATVECRQQTRIEELMVKAKNSGSLGLMAALSAALVVLLLLLLGIL